MAMSPRIKQILNMDREDFESLIDEYFKKCDDNNKPYLSVGLANHLRVYKQWFVDVRADKQKAFVGTYHKEVLQLANQRIELYLAERLFDKNDKKAVSAIFTLKTNHGWKEKEVIDLSNLQEIKINFQ